MMVDADLASIADTSVVHEDVDSLEFAYELVDFWFDRLERSRHVHLNDLWLFARLLRRSKAMEMKPS